MVEPKPINWKTIPTQIIFDSDSLDYLRGQCTQTLEEMQRQETESFTVAIEECIEDLK